MRIRELLACVCLVGGTAAAIACGDGTATKTKGGDDHVHEDEVELGSKDVAGYKVTVFQVGKINKLHAITIKASGGPESIDKLKCFAWLADAAGTKMLSPKGVGKYMEKHGDVDVDMDVKGDVPADAKAWISIEDSKGNKGTAAFDLKR